jgi:hypothetical protein
MDNFDLRKYLSEGTLLKEENFSDEFVNFGKELAGEIEDELEKKELNEALGVVGILGYILLSNTIVLMMSKFAKKQFAKRDWGKGEKAAKKIYNFAHKNEEAFKAPIKRVIGIFTKNEKIKKTISEILYAILILLMAGQAGGDAIKYLRKAGWLKGGLYSLKSLIKGKEVHGIIKDLISDIV